MHRSLVTAAATLALGLAAAPAQAADVGAQETIRTAGQTSPLTVGGTGVKEGSRLKKGQTLVKRSATFEGRERGSLLLTCARGSALQGLASEEGAPFSWAVVGKGSYVGKRSARVRFAGRAEAGESALAELYAICRRR